jgi:hypothetical protein
MAMSVKFDSTQIILKECVSKDATGSSFNILSTYSAVVIYGETVIYFHGLMIRHRVRNDNLIYWILISLNHR